MIEVRVPAVPVIVIDAAETCEEQQGSPIVRSGVLNFLPFPFGFNRIGFEPFRKTFVQVFLKEGLALDAVRIAAQDQRPFSQKGQDAGCGTVVVSEESAIRRARFWKINFVEVAEAKALAV